MKKTTLIILGVLLVAIAALVWFFQTDDYKARSVDSFAECVEANYPVMESYPRQCRAGDKLFVEDLNVEDVDTGETGAPPAPVETSMIRVTSPLPGSTVTSPLVVRGEARGNWYFEASFPIRILDANGNELAVVPAQAQGDWMTTEFVPFETSISFGTSPTATGTLVLERDNPSGLPEHAAEVRIPIRFSNTSVAERTVVVYHYDEERDTDSSGNIMCSAQGLVGVTRDIPVTMTPIQDTIRLLLKGDLTAAERQRGLTTEFPLQGVTLEAASLSNGVLTLTMSDPQNRTSGGACRVGILRSQIESTARQFSGVDRVEIEPAELFQP